MSYERVPGYEYIKEVRNMILTPAPNTEDGTKWNAEIITYCKRYCVNPNAYVRDPTTGKTWLPLIHLAMQYDSLQDFVKFLLKAKANPKLHPDGAGAPSILLTCAPIYLDYLSKAGCALSPSAIIQQLRSGSVDRLELLHKLGHISDADVTTLLERGDVPYELVQVCTKYLFYAYNIRTDITDKAQITRETLERLGKSLQYCWAHGAVVTDAYVTHCVEYYLHEFLPHGTNTVVPYHSYMDAVKVAHWRPLLNDLRYETTCRVCSQTPDPDLYKPLSKN
jgi:hypothetical protein